MFYTSGVKGNERQQESNSNIELCTLQRREQQHRVFTDNDTKICRPNGIDDVIKPSCKKPCIFSKSSLYIIIRATCLWHHTRHLSKRSGTEQNIRSADDPASN